jgi:hypothetical protein
MKTASYAALSPKSVSGVSFFGLRRAIQKRGYVNDLSVSSSTYLTTIDPQNISIGFDS